jgi:hypothetical protein
VENELVTMIMSELTEVIKYNFLMVHIRTSSKNVEIRNASAKLIPQLLTLALKAKFLSLASGIHSNQCKLLTSGHNA